MEPARELIHRVLLNKEWTPTVKERRIDSKTLLQELVQRKSGRELYYKLVGESGPDHNKTFVVEVFLNGETIGHGSGRSKKDAEQAAAKAALENWKDE